MSHDAVRMADALGDRSATGPLDVALEYLRRRPERVVGLYVLAVAPMTLAMLWVIDVVTAQQRSALPLVCVALTAATVWRWAFQALMQARVQADLRLEQAKVTLWRLGSILVIRAMANALLTWGALFFIPALFGLWLAGFATPMVLDRQGSAAVKLRETWQWMQHSLGRLARITSALSLLLVLAVVGVFTLHGLLLGTVLPSFLGVDVSELALTMSGPGWWIAVGYFIFLGFDLFWTVASVMVFYSLRSSRLGTDLRVRLQELTAA